MNLPRPSILDGFDHSAYWIRSVSAYSCLEIAYVAKGSCTLAIQHREVELSEGQVI